MSELITGGKAAEIVGVSRETISRWVIEGKLEPKLRLHNKTMLFEREDIEKLAAAYVDGRKTRQAEAV